MNQVDRPREEGNHLVGETVARWRSRLREMMKEDDAAELIAKSADTTLGVIGGEFGRKILFISFVGVLGCGVESKVAELVLLKDRWLASGGFVDGIGVRHGCEDLYFVFFRFVDGIVFVVEIGVSTWVGE